MGKIPYNEVVFDPHSFRDKGGRVFRWRGEIYRGIRAASASMFMRLLRDGVIQGLVEHSLLIERKLTDTSLSFGTVLFRSSHIPPSGLLR